jgi:hypothetical protein
MPVKRRNNKRHAAISDNEAAWLRGDRDCGFTEFKDDEELQKLWDLHGDNETMYWETGMSYPAPIGAHAT